MSTTILTYALIPHTDPDTKPDITITYGLDLSLTVVNELDRIIRQTIINELAVQTRPGDILHP